MLYIQKYTNKYTMRDIIYTQFDGEDLIHINPNKKYYCSERTRCSGWSLLMKLVVIPNVDIMLVENIIKNCDINYKNKLELTALMIACINSKICDNLDVIRLLLKYNADVNITNLNGYNVLMLYVSFANNCDDEVIKLLLKTEINVNWQANNGDNALIIASKFSNIFGNEIIKLLLENKANINLQDNNGYTALMFACINSKICDNLDAIRLLLKYNADVNITNLKGYNVLMLYVSFGNNCSDEVIKLLLKTEINVNWQANNGDNALIIALKKSYPNKNNEVMQLLLDNIINKNFNIEMSNSIFKHMNNGILDYYIHQNVTCIDKVILDLKEDINDVVRFTYMFHKNHMKHKVYFDDAMEDIIEHRNHFYFHPDNIYNKIVLLCNDNFNHEKITNEHMNKINMILGSDSINKEILSSFKDYLTS